MTKFEAFTAIRSIVADNAELVAFCDHEMELLAKRASAPSKPTKTQIENETHKETILNVLREYALPMTASEVAEEVGLSVNKTSALLTQLKVDELITRVEDKRKAYFQIRVGE